MFNVLINLIMCALVCLISITTCKIQPATVNENIVQRSVAKCVLKISDKHFSTGDIIDVASVDGESSFNNNILKLFYENYSWTASVRIATEKAYFFSSLTKTNNYIIHLNNLQDLNDTLIFLQQSLSWNPFAKFVIASHSGFDNPLIAAANITRITWAFRILNVVIMIPSNLPESWGLLDIYTWYPFEHGNCADRFNEIQLINRCEGGVLKDENTYLFLNKIPQNLNGCYVKVRLVEVPPYIILPKEMDKTKTNLNITEGVEIILLKTVAEAANFKLNYSVSPKKLDWGFIEEKNFTVVSSGLMKSLIDGEVDIGLGIISAMDIRYKYLDFSIPYMFDSLAWNVPHALHEPKWRCLFIIFHPSTWALTLLTLILAALCLWALSYKSSPVESVSYSNIQNCTLNIFAVFLGIAVHTQPRADFNRIFFVIWIIFSLHMTISYQTSLISVLTHPSYKEQISTIDELFDSKIPFGFVATAIRFFEDQDDWRTRKVFKEWVECEDTIICLKSIAYDRNYAFGVSRLFIRYNEGRFVDGHGRPLIYTFKDNIVVFPVNMQFSRGFPLIRRMNSILSKITESGLIEFWFKQLFRKHKVNIKTDSSSQQKLSLFNVQAAFIILAFGLFAASIAFGIELVIQKCKRQI